MKVLIIEDNVEILELLRSGFTQNFFTLKSAIDGEYGLYLALNNHFDIIVLDWMLPKKDGIEILQILRKNKIKTPVIMLSAKDEIENKIKGLEVGADDYLPKPFNFDELLARMQALYRRVWLELDELIYIKNICLNTKTKILSVKNQKDTMLSLKEYELFMFLYKNKNTFMSKFSIIDEIWSDDEFVKSNVLEAHIYKLRKKLGKDIIKSYKGLGYKIET